MPKPSRREVRRGRTGASVCVALTLALAGCAPSSDLGRGERPVVVGVGPLPIYSEAAGRAIARYRVAHGLGPVAIDPALTRVALRQAEAMARADTLSHTLAGELTARVAAEGIRRGAEAENVSAGYASFEGALIGWEHSPGHDANLLYRPIRRIGIAAATAPGTRYKAYWALVMTD